MTKAKVYTAKKPDSMGIIHYTAEENSVWSRLMEIQTPLIKTHMCEEYRDGFEKLKLPTDRIPQCHEISTSLSHATGWKVAPVPALIGFKTFFKMLSEKVFPAASFIRSSDEIGYLKEPDIFHEIMGHTPLLMHSVFADFTQMIGTAGSYTTQNNHVWLARLYWMTIEFGLINTKQGLSAYGAGLASSNDELSYSVNSALPIRKPFHIIEALRTPYRIDILQPVYFVLDSFNQLLSFTPQTILDHINDAQLLGLYSPTYD